MLETEQYRRRDVKNRGGGVYRLSQLAIVSKKIEDQSGGEGLLRWFKQHLQEVTETTSGCDALIEADAVDLTWEARIGDDPDAPWAYLLSEHERKVASRRVREQGAEAAKRAAHRAEHRAREDAAREARIKAKSESGHRMHLPELDRHLRR